MDFFDLDEAKALCVFRECTNARQKHNDGGFHRFCRRCRDRRYEQKNPLKYAFDNLRKSAKKRDYPFTLTIEQFKKFCDETRYMELRGIKNPDFLTVDRIDSTKGYEDGNIRVATNFENGSKGNRPDLPQPGMAPAGDEPW